MGRLRNEMRPHINNTIATTSTRKRLLRAKSTSLRIMLKLPWDLLRIRNKGDREIVLILYSELSAESSPSLLQCVLENERVGHYLIPRFNAGPDFLHVS